MNRLLLISICVSLVSCGGNTSSKSSVTLDAESYTSEALIAYNDEDWLRARLLFNRALTLYQGVDSLRGVITSQINLVEVALSEHNNLSAEKYLKLADNGAKNGQFDQYQLQIMLLYARLALQETHFSEADAIFKKLLAGFETVTEVDGFYLSVLANRTKLAFAQKQGEVLWTQYYADALQRFGNQHDGFSALLLRFQSKLFLAKHDYIQTENKLQQALLIYKKNEDRQGIAMTLFELGVLSEKQQHWQEADDYFNRSSRVFHYLRHSEMIIKLTKKQRIVKSKLEASPMGIH